MIRLWMVVWLAGASALLAAEPLLPNGDFAAGLEGWWVPESPQKISLDAAEKPEGTPQSLRVVIQAEHGHYGEVGQYIKGLKPHTAYTVDGWVRSTSKGIAFFQVKRLKARKELDRTTSGRSDTEWTRVAVEFGTGDADEVLVLCRWVQSRDAKGETALFAGVRLVEGAQAAAIAEPPEPGPPRLKTGTAVPTFDAIGLAVVYGGTVPGDAACHVRFRKKGDGAWRAGLDLIRYRPEREFRGSLFHLEPDSEYEIECQLADARGGALGALGLAARTWREDVPIGQVRRLPAGTSAEPLVIRDQGTPDAWVLYAPPEGAASTIDAAWKAPNAVRIEGAAFVVLQNVAIRGGSDDGVYVVKSHHIRIRRCDIAGWGDPGTRKDGLEKGLYVDKRGRLINGQAGVQLHRDCAQVVVEDCFIHHPRGTANSWKFGHPAGPQGINLSYTAGNNVIRNNDLVGSEEHWWNDAIEGVPNSEVFGGPHRDTDICGNVLAFSNDDGTELDGGQINVRFTNNWVDKALCGVSCAPNRRGPSYVLRNLFVLTGDEHFHTGAGFKMGGDRFPFPGLSLLLHNTVYTHGQGLTSGHYGKGPTPMRTRNNVFMGPVPGYGRIRYRHREGGDFDHDLIPAEGIHGVDPLPPAWEAHAVVGYPKVRGEAACDLRLQPDSPGIDAALRLPNINDDFAGDGPDLGAFEHGRAEALFPVRSSGLSALPLHVRIEGAVGGEAARGEVRLRVPPSAGSRWTAHPSSPWLRCVPPSGPAADAEQKVALTVARVDLETRMYRGAVTFRTDAGLNRTVMVYLKVYPARRVAVGFEAEAGKLEGGLVKVSGPAASGGAYLHTPEEAEGGTATIRFEVPEDGFYHILARCMVPPPAATAGVHDSFYFTIDGGEKRLWDLHNAAVGWWTWQRVVGRKEEAAAGRRLAKGAHTLTIASREKLARIDRIVVTNSPYPEPPRQ